MKKQFWFIINCNNWDPRVRSPVTTGFSFSCHMPQLCFYSTSCIMTIGDHVTLPRDHMMSCDLAKGSHDVTWHYSLTEDSPLDHPSGQTSPWMSVNWKALTSLSTSSTDRPTWISLIIELRTIPLPSIMNNALGVRGGEEMAMTLDWFLVENFSQKT